MASFWLSLLLTLTLTGSFRTANGQGDLCGSVGDAETLQMTVVLFRHGDRTPLFTYPNDPYQEDTWLPWGGWACLTQVGMRQHFNFGRWMRGCYGKILTDIYHPKEVFVRSTDIDRTLISALSHLAGLFTPHDFQIWSDKEELAKLWQPVPIHTVSRPDEYLLTPDAPCPPYQAMLKDLWDNSPRTRDIQAKEQDLLNYIAKNAGLKVPGDVKDILDKMTDSVYVEVLKNLTLPNWLNQTIVSKLRQWKDTWLHLHVANDEMLRLGLGDIMYNFQELFKNKSEGKVPYKHVIYSAHDSTVGVLLKVLDPTFPLVGPPYASGVILELHRDKASNRHFVKVFYRNDTTVEPYPIKLRNCDDKCWLDDYLKAFQPFTLADKRSFCAQPVKSNGGLDKDAILAIAVCATFVGTVLLVSFIFIMIMRRK